MASRPHPSQRKHSDEIEIANFAAISTHLTRNTNKSPSRAQEINMSVKQTGNQPQKPRHQAAPTTVEGKAKEATPTTTHTATKVAEQTVQEVNQEKLDITATAGEAVKAEVIVEKPTAHKSVAKAAEPAQVVEKTSSEVELDVSTTVNAKGTTVLHVAVPAGEKVKVKVKKQKAPAPSGNPFKRALAIMAEGNVPVMTPEPLSEAELTEKKAGWLAAVSDPKGKIQKQRERDEKKKMRRLERKLGVPAHA